MITSVRGVAGTHVLDFRPAESAMIVLDMQRYFLDETSHAYVPSAVPVVPRLTQLAEAYRRRRRPVIFTRHMNSGDDAAMLAKWWRDVIVKDSPSSHIVADFDPSNAEVLEKTQYDAFYGTGLEKKLRGEGVTQVLICGVLTHLCCETTARSAFVRGFEVFFAVDGTATYDERFHLATVLNLAHGFAVPVLTRDIVERLAGHED